MSLTKKCGTGEGDPDSGATVEESDHRRPRRKGERPLGGDLVDARAQEQDAPRVQARALRRPAQHYVRRRADRRPPEGDGSRLRSGGAPARRVGAAVRAGDDGVAAGVEPPRSVLAAEGPRVYLEEDPQRRTPRLAPAAAYARRGGARHARQRALRPRARGRVQLLAKSCVRLPDAPTDDRGAARPGVHG